MAQYSKMTVTQLQMLREQLVNKKLLVEGRTPSKSAEVNAAFDDISDDLSKKIIAIDNEISGRS